MTLPKLPSLPVLPPRSTDELSEAMYEIAEVLTYPVDNRGRVYDVRFMLPMLAFHLARAGVRVHPDAAIIKKRRLPPSAGVVEDAVEWVGVNEPDSIDDELADATIADVDRLSPAARAELLRRLGIATADAPADVDNLDGRVSWHVETSIQFDDEDEER